MKGRNGKRPSHQLAQLVAVGKREGAEGPLRGNTSNVREGLGTVLQLKDPQDKRAKTVNAFPPAFLSARENRRMITKTQAFYVEGTAMFF